MRSDVDGPAAHGAAASRGATPPGRAERLDGAGLVVPGDAAPLGHAGAVRRDDAVSATPLGHADPARDDGVLAAAVLAMLAHTLHRPVD